MVVARMIVALTSITGWVELKNALFGFAVLMLTMLGPKILDFTRAWLDSKMPNKKEGT